MFRVHYGNNNVYINVKSVFSLLIVNRKLLENIGENPEYIPENCHNFERFFVKSLLENTCFDIL